MTTHVRPQLRRKLALAAAVAALAVPTLSACGFDYATDRPNEIIHGGTDLGDGVRVNAARIVTPTEGRGVFIATLTVDPKVNAATTGSALPTLTGVETGESAAQTVNPTKEVEVQIADSGAINLADPEVGGVAVRGNFAPGDVIPMVLEFDEGEPVELNVPVVTQCGPYADVVAAGGALAPSEADGTVLEDAYSCEHPETGLPEEH